MVALLTFGGMQVANKVEGVITIAAGVGTAAVVTAGLGLASAAALAGTKVLGALGDIAGAIFD